MQRRTLLDTRDLVQAALALAALAATASAQTTIVVNDTRDLADFDLTDGIVDAEQLTPGEQRTLRAAVQHACYAGGDNIIELPASTFALQRTGQDDVGARGDLDIYAGTLTGLTIRCSVGTATIDASPLAISQTTRDRIFDLRPLVPTTLPVTLEHLVLTGGSRLDDGGGIRVQGGALTLNDVHIQNCIAARGGGIYSINKVSVSSSSIAQCTATQTGGAIYAVEDLTLDSSTISACTATQSGGGLMIDGGLLTRVTNSSFTGNSSGTIGGAIAIAGNALQLHATNVTMSSNQSNLGGGLYADAVVVLTDCTLSNNFATGDGGGFEAGSGIVTVIRTQMNMNSAVRGGGMHISPFVAFFTVIDSTFDTNHAILLGGGISHERPGEMYGSTISRNTADVGAGIDSEAPLDALNCTISSNVSTSIGGGIYVLASGLPQDTRIESCTIAFNQAGQGGGLYLAAAPGSPFVRVRSTLIGNNRSSTTGTWQNFAGNALLQSYGANLDSDGTCSLSAIDYHGTIAAPLDPLVLPLLPNGGPTQTHELTYCSPALERGAAFSFITGSPNAIDQRGVARTPLPDIGAFEAPFGTSTLPTTLFCFGDGTGTPCPCGNNAPAGSATGCVNSHGTAAMLTSTGLTSVSAANLVLTCNGVPPNASALFFQGVQTLGGGLGLPFGDGLLCIASPTLRLGLVSASAGGIADYPGQGHLPVAVQGLVQPGDTRVYQCWYRDPASYCTPGTYNLSNALRVTWCP